MAQFDMALDDLRAYRPEIDEPDDFDEFWQAQLAGAAEYPLAVSLDAVEIPLRYVDVSDVWFAGHGGSRVGAWLYVPHDLDDDMPLVIEFAGYNGGRGRALEWLHWSAVGYPHLVVDSRGQGGGWRRGDTPDPGNPGEAGSRTILTSGLSSPDQHYYSRLFTDAARATLAVGEIPAVAGRRIVVSGASQGGALSLAAAALGDGVALVMPDVPFLSHFRRAVAFFEREMRKGVFRQQDAPNLVVTGYGGLLTYFSDQSMLRGLLGEDPYSEEALVRRFEHLRQFLRASLEP